MCRAIILVLLLNLALGRIIQITIPFRQFNQRQSWIYLDKMTFAPGTVRVRIETSTVGVANGHPAPVFMVAIPDDRWDVQSKDKCNAPMKMPLAFHELKVDNTISESSMAFSLEDYRTFYFLLKDCQKRLLADYDNPNLTLNIKFHILNNDREVGQQEDHWYILPFLIISGLVIVYYYMKQYKSIHDEGFNSTKMLLFMGTVTQISSLFWKSIGFIIYVYTGSDHFFFNLIYLFLHSASESAILALLCLMAFGWTLTFNYGKQFQMFIPIVACLGVMNIILTMITKLGDEHNSHHIFDNVGGSILVVYRLIIAVVFLIGIFVTYKKARDQVKSFMIKLAVFGFIYVISMPFVVNFANYATDPKNRHEFVFISIQVIKFIANAILMYEVNSKLSEYSKINFSNTSFLPQEKGFK